MREKFAVEKSALITHAYYIDHVIEITGMETVRVVSICSLQVFKNNCKTGYSTKDFFGLQFALHKELQERCIKKFTGNPLLPTP